MGTVVGFPARFSWENKVESALITADSEDTNLPWNNLASPHKTKIGRSLAGLTQAINVDFDLGSAEDVQSFFLNNHNLSSSATITLKGSNNAAHSPTGVSEAVTWFDGLIAHEFDPAETWRFWRLTIDDTSNPDGYVEAGHAFLGPYEEFDLKDDSTTLAETDPSVIREAINGAFTVYEREGFQVIQFLMSPVDQADRRSLEAIRDDRKIGKPFYLSLDPTEIRDSDGLNRFSFYVAFVAPMIFNHMSHTHHRVQPVTVQELR